MPRTDDGSYHLPSVASARNGVGLGYPTITRQNINVPHSCHGCGAPFCASGCEYCGRGSVVGKAHTEIGWSGQMVIDNLYGSIRAQQHNVPLEHLAAALNGGRR